MVYLLLPTLVGNNYPSTDIYTQIPTLNDADLRYQSKWPKHFTIGQPGYAAKQGIPLGSFRTASFSLKRLEACIHWKIDNNQYCEKNQRENTKKKEKTTET